jgi:hypothetical protein
MQTSKLQFKLIIDTVQCHTLLQQIVSRLFRLHHKWIGKAFIKAYNITLKIKWTPRNTIKYVNYKPPAPSVCLYGYIELKV